MFSSCGPNRQLFLVIRTMPCPLLSAKQLACWLWPGCMLSALSATIRSCVDILSAPASPVLGRAFLQPTIDVLAAGRCAESRLRSPAATPSELGITYRPSLRCGSKTGWHPCGQNKPLLLRAYFKKCPHLRRSYGQLDALWQARFWGNPSRWQVELRLCLQGSDVGVFAPLCLIATTTTRSPA